LKRPAKEKKEGHATAGTDSDDDDAEGSADSNSGGNRNTVVAERLDKLEHLIQEMNNRLKTIETRLPTEKR
jgi:hypothetical protein